MKGAHEQHHRKSIRLKGYDYTAAGYYFVTICVHKWQCLFGNIVNGKIDLNQFGKIVEECWQEIPDHFGHTELDLFVIMPNHLHGIIIINDQRRGTACRAPTTTDERMFGKPIAGSLSTIMGSFKSAATKIVNKTYNSPGTKLWQRNYYERIIRNEKELHNIRQYIIDNPLKWELEKETPKNWDFEI